MLFIYLFIRLFIYLIIYVFIYLFVYLFFEEQRISKKWVSGLIKVHIQMSYFPPYNSVFHLTIYVFSCFLQLWRP